MSPTRAARRRRLVPAVAAVVLLAPAAVAAASPRVEPRMTCKPAAADGRELVCTVPVPPSVKVRSANVRVLLPAGYARGRASYPVVFMLHGVGDDETAWTSPARGDLARLTTRCRAIFVMPDGGSGTEAGWYSDWVDGSFTYETFHTRVLPGHVHAALRTQGPRRQAVAGMSMGGFGALSYAARHPGLFRAVASYSGFVDSMFLAPASGEFYDSAGQSSVYSTGTPSRRVWGSQSDNAAEWRAHNPWDLAERLRGVPLYLSSGSGTPGGPHGDDPGKGPNYAVEAYVGHLNDRFAARLQEAGVAYADARYVGGYHDWVYWRAALTDSLTTLLRPLGAVAPGCGA